MSGCLTVSWRGGKDAVESFDLAAFYGDYRSNGQGAAAFDPALMVAVLLYAHAVGVRSSRQIEKRCIHDVAFRVLAGNRMPDHATVARFVKRHRFREPGFSKERRLEPQITIGLLTDASGFPLMVSAFEGNRAETRTMLPVIEAFMTAHRLPDVTVVADAGMISAANQHAIEAAGLSFILGGEDPRRALPGVHVAS